MLRSILKPSFLLPVLYVSVSISNVHCHVIGKYSGVDLTPELSLANDQRITDVGRTSQKTTAASGQGATHIALFEHLDRLHANVDLLTAFFLYLTYKTLSTTYGRWLFLANLGSRPRVILHCEPHFQQQLSPQNIDTLIFALRKAHIRTVYFWHGNPLLDQDMVNGWFSGGYWQGTIPPWTKNGQIPH